MSLQPPVYRQEALKKYRSPEPFEAVPYMVPLYGWVALLAFACLTLALVLWGVFGMLVTRVNATGAYNGSRLIVTLEAGQALDVRVGTRAEAVCGDTPATGQVEAVTYNDQQAHFDVTIILDEPPGQPAPCSVALRIREERPIERVFPLQFSTP